MGKLNLNRKPIAACLLVAAIAFVGWQLYSSVKIQFSGQAVSATVTNSTRVRIRKRNSSSSSSRYGTKLQLSFVDREGESRTASIVSRNGSGKFGNGTNVDILYDPANPERVYFNSFWGIWSKTIVLSCSLVVGLLFLVFRGKWRKRE